MAYKQFKDGRKDVNDAGRPKHSITEENIEKMRKFMKISKKLSVRFIEIELHKNRKK